ncbi:PREDICTED: serine/threonine-protein kinase rio2-like [Ipomoea nil]|uniref:serine/threonine-protein kinase rio2-like n=1 Tax=Ipomoea nil TaxID=35883 RepID=UPI000900F244|nr:PREDICTED: serine/threonine-protein kinase rio2-like [Ipomoea nil]
MKELRYAMLLSKIKTALEKLHQNDPNCEVSGSKDENGKEISDESDREKEDEDDAATDDADADDENDDDDDADDDDNQNGDGETSHTQPEDLSRALVPHVQPMDETPIKREEAISREDKMDTSPVFIISASGGKMEAPSQAEQMDTSPTNIEEESPLVSPHHVMNLMRETVHTAEIIHREYLTLRQRDTQTLEDLSKKVDHLTAAQASLILHRKNNPNHHHKLHPNSNLISTW